MDSTQVCNNKSSAAQRFLIITTSIMYRMGSRRVPPKTAMIVFDYYADDNWMEGLLVGNSPRCVRPQAETFSSPGA
jgi:hypothetical protein